MMRKMQDERDRRRKAGAAGYSTPHNDVFSCGKDIVMRAM